jgi:hypothetical protein
MTVRAEKLKVRRHIVAPISVDVIEFNGDFAAYTIPLGPPTSRAQLSKFPNKIFLQ